MSHDTLVLIAELAVAVAGFSSVIVALESRGVRYWSALQRFNLRVLLQVSALAIFFSLFPLILERLVEPPASWRWALSVYGLVHLIDVSSFMWRTPPETGHVHRIFQRIGLLASLASLLVAAFGSLLACEVVYLSVLVWHLAVAAMGFVLLVFGSSGEDPGASRRD